MIRDGQVLGDFVELVGVDDPEGVLLPVDRPQLQGRVDLGEGQRRGSGPEGSPGFQVGLHLRHADLHALDIGKALDGLLGGQLPRRAHDIVEDADVGLRNQPGPDLVAHRPFHDGPHMRVVLEEEGKLEDGHGRVEVLEDAPQDRPVHRAHLDPLGHIPLTAQDAADGDTHLQRTVAVLLGQLAELDQGLALVVDRRVGRGEDQLDGIGRPCARDGEHRNGQRKHQ